MTTAQPKPKKPKSPKLAAFLNLIPLAGLASCSMSARDAPNIDWEGLYNCLWFTFIWGVGYLYVRKPWRFLLSLPIPWISIFAGFSIGLDFEHAGYTTRDLMPWLLMVALICIITAVDAGRVAVAYNAGLQNPPPDNPKPRKKPAAKKLRGK